MTQVVSDVRELVNGWIQSLREEDRSQNTIRSYAGAVGRFLDWYEREERRALELADLTPIALQGYRNDIQHHQGKATASVNTEVGALRSWGGWLADQGYLHTNPTSALKSVGRQQAPSPKGLNDRQVNALLREAGRSRHPARNYALVQLMLQTGLRVGECAALELEDIHFGERSGNLWVRGGKNNKSRHVPLNASARSALVPYVAPILEVAPDMPDVAATWPRRKPGLPGTPLWRSQKGGRLSTTAMRRVIDELVKDCSSRGLVPVDASPHTLRHTFAHYYLKQHPGDLAGLATLLGHSSLDTTRIYVQPSSEMLASRVDELAINAYGD